MTDKTTKNGINANNIPFDHDQNAFHDAIGLTGEQFKEICDDCIDILETGNNTSGALCYALSLDVSDSEKLGYLYAISQLTSIT